MPDIVDSDMKTYGEFRPTAMDPRGLAAATMGHDEDDSDRSSWLVLPVSQTRDSGALSRSNFRVALRSLEALDPDGADHEVHRFGHWGPGWYEIILVRPETKAHIDAWEIECSLSSYPVLSDEDYSELEWEEKEEEDDED